MLLRMVRNDRVWVLGIGALFALAATATFACGSEASDPNASSSSGGASSGNGSSSFGGNTDGGNGDPDGSSGSSGGNCFAPVDMFVMFDRSGSMREPLNDNQGDCTIGENVNSKWCKSINALSRYFNSQGATGQAAALQFFPLQGHSNALCNSGDLYNVAAEPPAATLFQTLPSNTFDAILNSTAPGGGGAGGSSGTPTEAAIRGVTRFTSANRRPGRVTIGILITDGDPNGCDQGLAFLSNLLQAHFAATTVRTYLIGMQGASFDNLEAIAQGGNGPMHPDAVGGLTDACGNGAGPCRHWNVGDGDPAAFTAALAAIQESADGCKPGGGTVNPGPK